MDVGKITDEDVDRVIKPLFQETPSSLPVTVGLVDAARLTGKSTPTIHEAWESGRLGHILVNGKRRVDVGELNRVYPLVAPDDGKRSKPGARRKPGYGARTGIRVVFQIASVLDYAASPVKKLRKRGDNPARWKGGFDQVYKVDETPEGHWPAIPWRRVPELFVNLHAVQRGEYLLDNSPHLPKALAQLAEVTALNLGRGKEYREARWSWVDWSARVLLVPATHMKRRKLHRKPLCPRVMEILTERYADRKDTDNNLIFPCREKARSGNPRLKPIPLKVARPFTEHVVLKLIKRCCPPGAIPKLAIEDLLPLDSDESIAASAETVESLEATVHGLRSSYRDWAGENDQPRDMVELNLAHKIFSDTEEAYARSEYLEGRRKVQDAWSAHCLSLPDSSFVPPMPYVRPDQPAIDEAWRLWFAGEANSRLHAAKLAVGDNDRTTAVMSVYNNMLAQPRKDAPPPKQAAWGTSRDYANEAAQLLLTKEAGNITQAAKMIARRSNGAVKWEAIAQQLRRKHSDETAQASGTITAICEYCGESFQATRTSAKYCSPTHNQAAFRERHRADKLAVAAD